MEISECPLRFHKASIFYKCDIIYNHNLVCNFSEILKDSIMLFRQYANGSNIEIETTIADNIFIKADPLSINRIINNLIENSIKFSNADSVIEVTSFLHTVKPGQ